MPLFIRSLHKFVCDYYIGQLRSNFEIFVYFFAFIKEITVYCITLLPSIVEISKFLIVEIKNDKVHLRHVMLYEFRKGVSVGTAQKNISSVYLDRAPALNTVKKWFGRFRNGDFNLEDQPRSGRPSSTDDDAVSNLVQENPRITTEQIAERLNIYNSTAFRHLKKLGYVSKLDTWVPHLLTERNKLDRMNVAISLLARHNEEFFWIVW